MAKNYYSELQSTMQIIKKTCKLLRLNKKIFLFIVLATMIPYSLFFLANKFILVSLSKNLNLALMALLSIDPKTPEYLAQICKIQEDTIQVFLVEMFYFLLKAIVSMLSMVSTIYVSGMSYLGKDLTLKELWLKIKQIWVRPLITWLYISLMVTGVFFVIFIPSIFAVFSSIFVVFARGSSKLMLGVGIVPIVLVVVVNFYLGLVWLIGLVSSVLEDCYGLEALGKAEKLVSGKKKVGFVLIIILVVPFNAIYLLTMMSNGRRTEFFQFFTMYFAVNLGILLNIVSMMTCTVFYFDCKHSRGEQLELEEEMGYTKVSTIPLNL